jgi:hypothetical protein
MSTKMWKIDRSQLVVKIIFHRYRTQFDVHMFMLNHTANLLGRRNSFGLCSSHAAVQNETKDGRTCGVTVVRVIASDLLLVFPPSCLYQRGVPLDGYE